MIAMAKLEFREYIFDRFIEWEKEQPGRRSSVSAFARWLSQNSFDVVIKQQLVSDWIKGRFKPSDDRFVLVLAEKLGDEIFNILERQRPDPDLHYITAHWLGISPEERRAIREIGKVFEFTSDIIPPAMLKAIKASLPQCKTEAMVKGVFKPYKKQIPPKDAATVLEGIRLALVKL